MSSFSRCWLPNEDRQVWLRCEKKLWSENNSISHWLYLNQLGALVKEIFSKSELLEICMSDAMLIFVSPYFQFCLRAEAVMEGIKEILEWFQ